MKNTNYAVLAYILLALCYTISCNNDNNLGKPDVCSVKIESSLKNELYIKQITWGLTSDKRRTFVSTNQDIDRFYTSDSDLVFFDYDCFFYRYHEDTLWIVTRQKSFARTNFPREFVIVQKEIDNVEFQNNFNMDKYKKLGFLRVEDSVLPAPANIH